MKAEGNAAVAAKDFPRAVTLYSDAIALVPTEAIYYSNRSPCLLHVVTAIFLHLIAPLLLLLLLLLLLFWL